ncbi:MAG: hypothetical protein AAF745_15630 [Planctomycetota bacterium]
MFDAITIQQPINQNPTLAAFDLEFPSPRATLGLTEVEASVRHVGIPKSTMVKLNSRLESIVMENGNSLKYRALRICKRIWAAAFGRKSSKDKSESENKGIDRSKSRRVGEEVSQTANDKSDRSERADHSDDAQQRHEVHYQLLEYEQQAETQIQRLLGRMMEQDFNASGTKFELDQAIDAIHHVRSTRQAMDPDNATHHTMDREIKWMIARALSTSSFHCNLEDGASEFSPNEVKAAISRKRFDHGTSPEARLFGEFEEVAELDDSNLAANRLRLFRTIVATCRSDAPDPSKPSTTTV